MEDNKNEFKATKKNIEKLTESFNDTPNKLPNTEVLKPVATEYKKDKSRFSPKEDSKQKFIDSGVILDKNAPRIEKISGIRQRTGVLKMAWRFAKPHWIFLVLALICAIINSILELFIPVCIGNGIDCLIGKDAVDFVGLKQNIIQLIICAAGFAVFKWLVNFFENVLSFRTDKDMRDAMFRKFNKVPLKYIDRTSHGDLQSRMINDVSTITDGFLIGLSSGFDAIVSIVLVLTYLFKLDLTIAIVIICLTPISIVITAIIVAKSDKYFHRQAKAKGDLSGHIVEYVGNQKVVMSFVYEDRSIDKFSKINDNLGQQTENAVFYSTLTGPTSRCINGIIYAIVAILGCVSAIRGNLTIGGVSILLSYANKYIKPFNEISDIVSDIQSAFASGKRVCNVLDIEDEPSDATNQVLTVCDGSVDIENVYFSYTENKKLIENLSVSVKSGQKVAIVGPTGCGKSTLINLLMRFYDVNDGDIKVSGKSIYDLQRASMRSKYGMVLQDTWLFNASVRDNIAYGKPDATMEEIIEAAKLAHVHEFILTLAQGYDTIVSESGDNLSQGQRQLLCIARIMLAKPPMLILDEATSNIDTRTELLIQKAFDKMMEGRTSFVVAHRLSTIVSSDLILVMDKGNIIEQGSHEELLAKKGFYYSLYNSQFSST